MVNAFEDKISQGHTLSLQPMMKNDCVSQSFRYEAFTDHPQMPHTVHFDCYLSADIYCHDFSPPFRPIGNVPLETNATFIMTSLSTCPLSLLTLAKAATSMTRSESVLMVSPAASPRRTLHRTSKPWRTRI